MDHAELTPELASRMATIAMAADVEHWARSAVAIDGRVGVNDLVRTLDVIRGASAVNPTNRYRTT
jgi:hypothetical protein